MSFWATLAGACIRGSKKLLFVETIGQMTDLTQIRLAFDLSTSPAVGVVLSLGAR